MSAANRDSKSTAAGLEINHLKGNSVEARQIKQRPSMPIASAFTAASVFVEKEKGPSSARNPFVVIDSGFESSLKG